MTKAAEGGQLAKHSLIFHVMIEEICAIYLSMYSISVGVQQSCDNQASNPFYHPIAQQAPCHGPHDLRLAPALYSMLSKAYMWRRAN